MTISRLLWYRDAKFSLVFFFFPNTHPKIAPLTIYIFKNGGLMIIGTAKKKDGTIFSLMGVKTSHGNSRQSIGVFFHDLCLRLLYLLCFFRNLLSMFQVVPFLLRPIKWLVTFVWILVKLMTQLFFTKPLQSHRHHQLLDKRCGKPRGTVATTCYFSPLLLAK